MKQLDLVLRETEIVPICAETGPFKLSWVAVGEQEAEMKPNMCYDKTNYPF